MAGDGRELVGVWPGFRETIYGVAIDLGFTTIAAHLCDLASGEVLARAGVMNPQIRFGEDLMTPVSYVMMNAGGERQRALSSCPPRHVLSYAADPGSDEEVARALAERLAAIGTGHASRCCLSAAWGLACLIKGRASDIASALLRSLSNFKK